MYALFVTDTIMMLHNSICNRNRIIFPPFNLADKIFLFGFLPVTLITVINFKTHKSIKNKMNKKSNFQKFRTRYKAITKFDVIKSLYGHQREMSTRFYIGGTKILPHKIV